MGGGGDNRFLGFEHARRLARQHKICCNPVQEDRVRNECVGSYQMLVYLNMHEMACACITGHKHDSHPSLFRRGINILYVDL